MGWTCRISEPRGVRAGNCWRKALQTTGCGSQLGSLRQFLCFTINLHFRYEDIKMLTDKPNLGGTTCNVGTGLTAL